MTHSQQLISLNYKLFCPTLFSTFPIQIFAEFLNPKRVEGKGGGQFDHPCVVFPRMNFSEKW